MSEQTFVEIGMELRWCFERLRWPVAVTFALLALVLTEGW